MLETRLLLESPTIDSNQECSAYSEVLCMEYSDLIKIQHSEYVCLCGIKNCDASIKLLDFGMSPFYYCKHNRSWVDLSQEHFFCTGHLNNFYKPYFVNLNNLPKMSIYNSNPMESIFTEYVNIYIKLVEKANPNLSHIEKVKIQTDYSNGIRAAQGYFESR